MQIGLKLIAHCKTKVILKDLNALFGIVNVLVLDRNLWANLDS